MPKTKMQIRLGLQMSLEIHHIFSLPLVLHKKVSLGIQFVENHTRCDADPYGYCIHDNITVEKNI